jgi:hypothetical protein
MVSESGVSGKKREAFEETKEKKGGKSSGSVEWIGLGKGESGR